MPHVLLTDIIKLLWTHLNHGTLPTKRQLAAWNKPAKSWIVHACATAVIECYQQRGFTVLWAPGVTICHVPPQITDGTLNQRPHTWFGPCKLSKGNPRFIDLTTRPRFKAGREVQIYSFEHDPRYQSARVYVPRIGLKQPEVEGLAAKIDLDILRRTLDFVGPYVL